MFVGRRSELDALREQFEIAREGSPRVVLIEGGAGLGKTALVRTFLSSLEDVRLLQASGDEDEANLAGAVLDQLARSAGRGPRSMTAADSAALDPVNAGVRLLDLIGSSDDGAPVVLVCDDAHWADGATLRAMTFAFRRLVAERFMAIVLFRPGEAKLPEGLLRLAGSDVGLRLALSSLDTGEVRAVASSLGAGDLTYREADRLREHAGGNPLHVAALVAELDRDALHGPPERPLPAPRSYASLVCARLSRLSRDAQKLAVAASVLGGRANLHEVSAVAELDDPVPPLQECLDAGLLHAEGIGPEQVVGFTHPLVRAALYHDQGPAARTALHARAGRASSDRPARLRHLEAAAVGPDEALSREFVDFAESRIVRGDVGQAARAFTSAARLEPNVDVRERLLVEATACHVFATEIQEALALCDEAKDFKDRAARLYMQSYPLVTSGRFDEGVEMLDQAWDALDPDADPRLACYIAIRASTTLSLYRPVAEIEAWSMRAIEHDPSGDLTGNAMFTLATGLAQSGRFTEGLALVDRLRARAGTSDIGRDRWLLPRGILRLWSDDVEGGVADLRVATDVTRRHGPTLSWLVALNLLTDAEFRAGRWDDAMAHAELAASAVTDLDFVWLVPYLKALAVLPLAARGELAAAEAQLAETKRALAVMPADRNVVWTAYVGAHLAMVLGDHERVLDELEPATRMHDSTEWDHPTIHPWRELEAEALVALGRLDDAEASIARLDAHADRFASTASATSRLRGLLAVARSDADLARQSFEASLAVAPSDQPFRRALVQLSFGAFLRRTGLRREAQVHLTDARSALETLGAAPFLDRVDRELAASGLTPTKRRGRVPGKLTPQESAVVHYATNGLTNKEIASELVISVRTVEYHLKNAYLKLGVSSRRELIRTHAEHA